MTKARISTTIDADVLREARECCGGARDSSLVESALRALIAQHRRETIDLSYETYDSLPMTTDDEWGSLDSFLEQAGKA